MTTTNYTVGIGDANKISSKVLKPPGGETHDIFGAHARNAEAAPHRNTNHLQSSIFDENRPAAGSTPNRKYGNQGGGGASTIVFGAGEAEDLEPRKIKDYQKSNVFGEQNEPSYLNCGSGIRRYNASNGLADSQVFPVGQDYTPRTAARRRQAAGNPITGEGYLNGGPATNANGEPKENGQQNGAAAGARTRNPPGGHSTRLW